MSKSIKELIIEDLEKLSLFEITKAYKFVRCLISAVEKPKQLNRDKVIAFHEAELKRLNGAKMVVRQRATLDSIDIQIAIHEYSLNEINSGRLNEE
jgi:hypothetical protein